MNKIQLFENQKIRTAWDAETEEWYFSVQDIVAVLTDTVDAKDYIKKMKKRDPALNSNWGTICTLVEMWAADGKKRKVQAATMQGMFRIIQSIPSPKAEPFKIVFCLRQETSKTSPTFSIFNSLPSSQSAPYQPPY